MTESNQGIHGSIDRYLANRLSSAEREIVETRIVGDSAFRQEVELTTALRDGLRQLDKQGKIAPLLRARTGIWPRTPIAIAASILALALGICALLLYQRFEPLHRNLAAAPHDLVVAVLSFEQTRGTNDEPNVTWQRPAKPTRMEMRFDVGLEPAASYGVLIERMQAAAAPQEVLSIEAATAEDGTVSISVDPVGWASGDYRIRLEPKPAGAASPESTYYRLRITD
jgi:hypothetical protein